MTITTDSSERGFPFLALPAEIRNSIYALVLTPPSLPHIRSLATRGLCSDYILPPLKISPALLRTCRQINSEASSILYGSNVFASHPNLLTSMPYLVSPRRPITHGPGRFKIRKWYIHVRLDVDPKFDAEQLRQAFSGAEELEIEVFQPMFGGCDCSVLRLFERVRGVGKVRVTGSTGVDQGYAGWLERTLMAPIGTEVGCYVREREMEAWEVWVGNR